MPYPYVLDRGDELARSRRLAGRTRTLFPDALAVGSR